ncbi:MAG: thioredoxin family protein [Balneolaceae bacterium]|nr:thioredoxin family protein [Balneolaceae bacterium]MDR9407446.1 thioredoxin family protein [Balneolaceae bacterium]
MTDIKTAIITRGTIENAFTYDEYRDLIDKLLKQDKTTGENYSDSMLHYTKMNVHRMRRLDKQIDLKEELIHKLESLDRSLTWLILTEGWCGDAAQVIPVIQKMADQTKMIQTRYILRDEHLDIMDQFLTDGRARSIPKLICLDSKKLEILGEWGPRPDEAQYLFKKLKDNNEYTSQESAEKLHKWYADDKTESVQDEFIPLIEKWANKI